MKLIPEVQCIAPLPDADYETRRKLMRPDQGCTCHCWQPALPAQPPQEDEDDAN